MRWLRAMTELQSATVCALRAGMTGDTFETFVKVHAASFAVTFDISEADAYLIATCQTDTVQQFVYSQLEKDKERDEAAKKTVRSKLHFTAGTIDVTDPCYKRDTWCRAELPLEPGWYKYVIKRVDEGAWGIRVKEIRIVKESAGSKGIIFGKTIETPIGVDNGVAGFFENKPDYTDKDWVAVVNYDVAMNPDDNYPWIVETHKDTPYKCEGICTSSGLGDGSYECRELLDKNKKLCGYALRFL